MSALEFTDENGYTWPHPIVRHATDQVDCSEWRDMPEDAKKLIFEVVYEISKYRFYNGKIGADGKDKCPDEFYETYLELFQENLEFITLFREEKLSPNQKRLIKAFAQAKKKYDSGELKGQMN